MADPPPSDRSSTSITDLDIDTLTLCASFLGLRDLSNIAMSCSYLKRAAYSDSIWQSLYRQEWPFVVLPVSSVRESYLYRHATLRQFKYVDPLVCDISTDGKSPSHLLLDRDTIIFSQGPFVRFLHVNDLISGCASVGTRGSHNARVTCMRLLSLGGTCLHQTESECDDNILVTSSSDHFIRLWSKGGSRCFKGHAGPVCTLSDKLLGDDHGKIFASGGEDGTVRLWSIHSSGKRGQQALKCTLHGHDKAVSHMSVAGHKSSLLVSIARNGKIRVWDTTVASPLVRSSSCVGTTSVPVAPVDMKCHESLLYVAAGSSVAAFDLRTMSRVITIDQQAPIHSFEILPSKSFICTGGTTRAKLWDVRRVSSTRKLEPTFELDGHIGHVKHLHMDSHKVVTGGPVDPYVKVWETSTGSLTNSLKCSAPDLGCSIMAVNGCQIVTASGGDQENAFLRFRDFRTATCPVSSNPSEESLMGSKFWGPQSDSDSDDL